MKLPKALLCALTLLAVSVTAWAQSTPYRIKYHNPGFDKDGKAGLGSVLPSGPLAMLPVILAQHTFDGLGVCDPQGWTTVDRTEQDRLYFHVDDFAGLGGGSFGLLAPLNGAKSLWCGARPSPLAPECSFANAPGYGNNWEQEWVTRNCVHLDIGAQVQMLISHHTFEPDDYIVIGYRHCAAPCGMTELKRYTGMSAPAVVAVPLPSAAVTGGDIKVVIRVVTNPEGSDYDGLLGFNLVDTDGAVIVDDLIVTDNTGIVVPLEDFEAAAPGATTTTNWEAQAPFGYGDFAGLFPGATVAQQDGVYTDITCLWGFFNGSPGNYACGGLPGQAAVPHENACQQYLYNEVWSPWIPLAGAANQTTHLAFDVYEDLPLDNLVGYVWHVRERVGGGCPTPWRTDGLIGMSPWKVWRTGAGRFEVSMTPFMKYAPGTPGAEVQVSIGAMDLFPWFGPAGLGLGSGACHSHAPLVDDVEVYLDNTQSWSVVDADLFQDAFPAGGAVVGTVPCDAASADYVTVRVKEPSVGIDYLVPGVPASGPAVFLYVGTIGPKAGAIVSGGPNWPEVAAMSSADWTVIQMDFGAAPDVYTADVNDALYEPGDVVKFFFSARDVSGTTSYWTQFTGMTSEADAKANPMEMTCLPAGKPFLYVDGYNGFGAEPYFTTAFDAIGVGVDRFDRRGPEMFYNNTLGDMVSGPAQLAGYDAIIINTGSFDTDLMHVTDYGWLYDYLDQTPGGDFRGIYFSGDDLPAELATNPNAAALFTDYIRFNLLGGDHRVLGHPVSPAGNGIPFGCFSDPVNGDELVVYGGYPVLNDFDVIDASALSTVEMTYDGGADGAIVSQRTLNGLGGTACVMLSGFSFHYLRDAKPNAVPARVLHMYRVLTWLHNVIAYPVAVQEAPAVNRLDQNYPNPFNPVTTIAFSTREPGPVRVAVYDVSGALVRTLVNEELGAGEHELDWDGTDDAGRGVASGLYFYRIRAAGFAEARKMVLLK